MKLLLVNPNRSQWITERMAKVGRAVLLPGEQLDAITSTDGPDVVKTPQQTMAAAAGVSLGRVLDMSEQTFQPGPYPIMRAEMAMAKSADAAPVPLATGENAYKVTVNVSFEIKQ